MERVGWPVSFASSGLSCFFSPESTSSVLSPDSIRRWSESFTYFKFVVKSKLSLICYFPFPLCTLLISYNSSGLLIEYFTWLLPWKNHKCVQWFANACEDWLVPPQLYRCIQPVLLAPSDITWATWVGGVAGSGWGDECLPDHMTDRRSSALWGINKNTLLSRCLKGTCEQLTRISSLSVWLLNCHTPSSLPSCQSSPSSIDSHPTILPPGTSGPPPHSPLLSTTLLHISAPSSCPPPHNTFFIPPIISNNRLLQIRTGAVNHVSLI